MVPCTCHSCACLKACCLDGLTDLGGCLIVNALDYTKKQWHRWRLAHDAVIEIATQTPTPVTMNSSTQASESQGGHQPALPLDFDWVKLWASADACTLPKLLAPPLEAHALQSIDTYYTCPDDLLVHASTACHSIGSSLDGLD